MMRIFVFLLTAVLAASAPRSAPASGKTVFRDAFVIRTGNAVYSLSDLQTYSARLNDLHCFHPESLTYALYEELTKVAPDYFDVEKRKKKIRPEAMQAITERFAGLMKMIRYASGQSVNISNELPKAFKLSAQNRGCSLKGFEGSELKGALLKLAMVEVFLRSRFVAPGESSSMTPERLEGFLRSARSLEESIQNQLEHEVLGN